jgi:predicted nuclease of predicted toxin-antitoxin system
MRLLFDRNVEPKYIEPLASESWTTTAHVDDHFSQTASDATIADFAEANEWVLFSRDRPFFTIAATRNCGFLLLDKAREPSPSRVVRAVKAIRSAYDDHRTIRESIPGGWG